MMDYILQNMQYRYMENVIQQINRGAVQNVTKPSLSGTGFAHIFQQTQMAESGISAGDLDAIFEEASRTYGVPADLLKAVGKMESNFDPYAQSGAGAQGVMQLMPATAQSLGVTDPFDARSNIMGCLPDMMEMWIWRLRHIMREAVMWKSTVEFRRSRRHRTISAE